MSPNLHCKRGSGRLPNQKACCCFLERAWLSGVAPPFGEGVLCTKGSACFAGVSLMGAGSVCTEWDLEPMTLTEHFPFLLTGLSTPTPIPVARRTFGRHKEKVPGTRGRCRQ
ncbi:UNVERIFIED_CONTAM: hypothetical protein K2H54_023571 [Gekko kuhli]